MRICLRSIVLGALVLGAAACDAGSDADPSLAAGGSGGSSASNAFGGAAAVGGGTVSCECRAASRPFGVHSTSYTAGSILPSAAAALERDEVVAAAYDAWKARYMRSGCGDSRYYVSTEGDDGTLTVSEAHGYGMLISVLMAGYDPNAKTQFDGLFRFFRDHPSDIAPNLMAWHQNQACHSDEGRASASDGDLDIAYALLLADKQWGRCAGIDYRAEAGSVIAAIASHDVDPSGRWIVLGDWASPDSDLHDATRSSDFMPSHLKSFARATGNPSWIALGDALYTTLAKLQQSSGSATGLLPDFIRSPATNPQPAEPNFLEGPADGAYSYNACRDPWRIGVDFLMNGDSRAKALLTALSDWIEGVSAGDPSAIRAGYALDGSPLERSDYVSLAFIAPFGVAAMVDARYQSWLDALWSFAKGHEMQGYYDDSLRLLALITMSGNWWTPESVPCGS